MNEFILLLLLFFYFFFIVYLPSTPTITRSVSLAFSLLVFDSVFLFFCFFFFVCFFVLNLIPEMSYGLFMYIVLYI